MPRSLSQKTHTKIIDPLTKLTDNTTQALKIGVHWVNIYRCFKASCETGSSVGIATGYRLDGPGIESRWGARFSAPVQTGPGAHPASCTMGTGSFPAVKSGRGVMLNFYPLLVPWSIKSRTIHLLPLWAVRSVQCVSACTRVHFIFLPLSFIAS